MGKINFWEVKELKMYHFGVYPKDMKAVAEYEGNIFFNTPIIEVVCKELPTNEITISIQFYATFSGSDEREMLYAVEYQGQRRGLKPFINKFIREEIMQDEVYQDAWTKLIKRIERDNYKIMHGMADEI